MRKLTALFVASTLALGAKVFFTLSLFYRCSD